MGTVDKIIEWKNQGYSEEEISQMLDKEIEQFDLEVPERPVKGPVEVNGVTVPPELVIPYDPMYAFNDKPEKPELFKRKKNFEKFVPKFNLTTNAYFTLNGEKRPVKKLNVRDTIRVISKVEKWASYLSYNTPEMLVDRVTGKYRLMEILFELLNRAFGDWDDELGRPSDFSYSVIEEICNLLEVDEDTLLSSDPEEIYEAVVLLVENNKGFFMKLWSASGPIRETLSLITGAITSYIDPLKEVLSRIKKDKKE